jgi:hypothetical protein
MTAYETRQPRNGGGKGDSMAMSSRSVNVTPRVVVDRPPAHQLRLDDLHPQAAASQRNRT